MIEISNLCMHYQLGAARIDVLRSVNLSVAAGQRVAITGPSGSGKTSLLLLLSGLERPASGRVAIDGTALGGMDADALADLRRDRIGIVFQSFHLLPSLSALDNVALPLQMAHRPDAHERAAALLKRVGLGERQGHYPSQLSGGEQQRVAIARALVHRPHTGEAIRELLFELNTEAGTTLVLVTHDPDFAARCDRVLRLHDGHLNEVKTTERALDAVSV